MKQTKKTVLAFLLSAFAISGISAQSLPLKKPEKPFDPTAPYVMHNWGLSWSRVTRIQTQTTRSNFVWNDNLIGAFYSAQTGNLPLNVIGKLAILYPYHCDFNGMEQKSKQVILYAFDFNAGPIWTIPLGEISKLDLAPMFHFRYQLSDKYHHFDLGAGIFVGFEFPVTRKFSVLLNGEFAYDFGNLGTNGRMQPFNPVFSYSADLGFRITTRGANKFHYIKNKEQQAIAKEKSQAKAEERKQKALERKQKADEKKAAREQAQQEYKQKLAEYKEAKQKEKAAKTPEAKTSEKVINR